MTDTRPENETVTEVERALDRLASWGVQVLDAEAHALAHAHQAGHLSDLMALVRRAWETPHPGGPVPAIPDQIQRRRANEEARRFPSHRAPKPETVERFEERADAWTPTEGPRWEFLDDHTGFRCLVCDNGFGRYAHPDSVMAAADEHTAACEGGVL